MSDRIETLPLVSVTGVSSPRSAPERNAGPRRSARPRRYRSGDRSPGGSGGAVRCGAAVRRPLCACDAPGPPGEPSEADGENAWGHPPSRGISSSREDTSFIDKWLASHSTQRRVALRAPYLSAPAILVQTDMAATLSRRVAQELVRDHPLQISEFPFDPPRVRTTMSWHRRLDGHPAHRWLREMVVSVAGSL